LPGRGHQVKGVGHVKAIIVGASVGAEGAGLHQHPLEARGQLTGASLKVADLGPCDDLHQEDDQASHDHTLGQEHHCAGVFEFFHTSNPALQHFVHRLTDVPSWLFWVGLFLRGLLAPLV